MVGEAVRLAGGAMKSFGVAQILWEKVDRTVRLIVDDVNGISGKAGGFKDSG